MLINASPIEFSQNEILSVAIFLQVPVSEIIAASSKMYAISATERDILRQRDPKIYDYITYLDGIAYCKSNLLDTDTIKKTALLEAFLIINDDEDVIFEVNRTFQTWMINIKTNESLITDYQRALIGNYEKLTHRMSWKRWDIEAFTKAARKFKGKVEIIDDYTTLTFKKVKCGNQSEGYLQYKSIKMYLHKTTRQPQRVIYEFNNFFWDTSWGNSVVAYLHPHFTGGNLCFGNRSDDYNMYVASRSYSFMVEVIKEAINTYSDDGGPFDTVTNIRQGLATLQKLIDVNLVKDGKKSLKEVNDPRLWFNDMLAGVRCRHCEGFMVENVCATRGCRANPNDPGTCGNCGSPFVVSGWDEPTRGYIRTCPNDSCSGSPNYPYAISEDESPYCRMCGSTNLDSHFRCNDCIRGNREQWQLRSAGRVTRYVALNLIRAPWITQAEADTLRETHSVVTADSERPDTVVADRVSPGINIFNENYVCPECQRTLTANHINNNLYCGNNDCSNYSNTIFDQRRFWVIDRIPNCPECNRHLTIIPGRTLQCNNSDCDNYEVTIYNSQGSYLLDDDAAF